MQKIAHAHFQPDRTTSPDPNSVEGAVPRVLLCHRSYLTSPRCGDSRPRTTLCAGRFLEIAQLCDLSSFSAAFRVLRWASLSAFCSSPSNTLFFTGLQCTSPVLTYSVIPAPRTVEYAHQQSRHKWVFFIKARKSNLAARACAIVLVVLVLVRVRALVAVIVICNRCARFRRRIAARV